jgi:peptidoglycan-associated lipoprotein
LLKETDMNRQTSINLPRWALSALAVAVLAGCATSIPLGDPTLALSPVETRQVLPGKTGAAGGADAASSSATKPQSSVATVNLPGSGSGAAGAAADSALLAAGQRVVYFDFDSYSIKDDYKNLIEAQAKTLSANRSKRLVVEGHTDERGGREYNLALGQKRADAVVKSLALLGAGENQIEAVSFGKERPATTGSDESAWARNRRAELKDR